MHIEFAMKRQLGGSGSRWEDIKINFKLVGHSGCDPVVGSCEHCSESTECLDQLKKDCSVKSVSGLMGRAVHNLLQFSPGWLSSSTLESAATNLCLCFVSESSQTNAEFDTHPTARLPARLSGGPVPSVGGRPQRCLRRHPRGEAHNKNLKGRELLSYCALNTNGGVS